MRRSALTRLVCPACRAGLTLEVLTSAADEVMEGMLACRCGARYPIIGGVPRMLRPELLTTLVEDYPAFFRAHGARMDLAAPRPADAADATLKQRTKDAFGYEWTWAADYHAANFSNWLPAGLDPQKVFAGGMGLEVGCGAGRHAKQTASIAREHFAVDLSKAVDVAFAHTRRLPNCHVVQADVFHLPFEAASFDYVYCLGVLQHLPDPPAGFGALAEQPRFGGTLLVNVYQASRPVVLAGLELTRKITTRLPHRALQYLSVGAACVDYGLFIGPWRAMNNTLL